MEAGTTTGEQALEGEAARLAVEAKREKEEKARQANAAKQKRYRESMKAQGRRARHTWEKPLEPGWVRMAAPVIREGSVDIAKSNPAIKTILEDLCGAFIVDCQKEGVPQEVWGPIYRDILILLKPMGVEI